MSVARNNVREHVERLREAAANARQQAATKSARSSSDATEPELKPDPEPPQRRMTSREVDDKLEAARLELLELQRQEVAEARQRLQASRDRDQARPQRRLLFAGQQRRPYWR